MKEFVEKLIERLEEYKDSHLIERNSEQCMHCQEKDCAIGEDCTHCIIDKAKEIVNQLAEEFGGDINVGSKKQGWIPVTQRLPEENERVLCVTKKSRMETAIYRYGGFWACGSNWLKQTVAWQPLPTYNPEEKRKFSNEELDKIMDKILDSQEPKTRIERIRSMSVEELADTILERSEISTAIDFCQNFCGECENIPESECRKCLIQWLNSPVEQKKAIPTKHFDERFNKVI